MRSPASACCGQPSSRPRPAQNCRRPICEGFVVQQSKIPLGATLGPSSRFRHNPALTSLQSPPSPPVRLRSVLSLPATSHRRRNASCPYRCCCRQARSPLLGYPCRTPGARSSGGRSKVLGRPRGNFRGVLGKVRKERAPFISRSGSSPVFSRT